MLGIGQAWERYLELVGSNAHGVEIQKAWNIVVMCLNESAGIWARDADRANEPE